MLKGKNLILYILLIVSVFFLYLNVGLDINSSYSLTTEEETTTNNTENSSNTTEEIENTSKKVESSEKKNTKKYKVAVYISLIGIILLIGSILFVSLAKEEL